MNKVLKIGNENIENKDVIFIMHALMFSFDKKVEILLQENLDLSFSQFTILMGIHYCPDSTQKTVSSYINHTEAAVSRQIEKLKEKGYVLIVDNPNSRREHILNITKKGQEQFEKAYILISKLSKKIFESITNENMEIIRKSLDKVYKDMY